MQLVVLGQVAPAIIQENVLEVERSSTLVCFLLVSCFWCCLQTLFGNTLQGKPRHALLGARRGLGAFEAAVLFSYVVQCLCNVLPGSQHLRRAPSMPIARTHPVDEALVAALSCYVVAQPSPTQRQEFRIPFVRFAWALSSPPPSRAFVLLHLMGYCLSSALIVHQA